MPAETGKMQCCARCDTTSARCLRAALPGRKLCWQHGRQCVQRHTRYKSHETEIERLTQGPNWLVQLQNGQALPLSRKQEKQIIPYLRLAHDLRKEQANRCHAPDDVACQDRRHMEIISHYEAWLKRVLKVPTLKPAPPAAAPLEPIGLQPPRKMVGGSKKKHKSKKERKAVQPEEEKEELTEAEFESVLKEIASLNLEEVKKTAFPDVPAQVGIISEPNAAELKLVAADFPAAEMVLEPGIRMIVEQFPLYRFLTRAVWPDKKEIAIALTFPAEMKAHFSNLVFPIYFVSTIPQARAVGFATVLTIMRTYLMVAFQHLNFHLGPLPLTLADADYARLTTLGYDKYIPFMKRASSVDLLNHILTTAVPLYRMHIETLAGMIRRFSVQLAADWNLNAAIYRPAIYTLLQLTLVSRVNIMINIGVAEKTT